MSLADIETRAKAYAQARQVLTERVQAMRMGIDAVQRDHLPGIKRALNKVAEVDSELRPLILQAPECFIKPKTVVLHGTQLGFEKGKGKLTFDKPAKVVERIEKLMPLQVPTLIHTEKKPNKQALIKLPAGDLKKLGCTVSGTGEQVVVRPVDAEVDKMVAALLKSATGEANEEDADGDDA
jgi:hypothetical protein